MRVFFRSKERQPEHPAAGRALEHHVEKGVHNPDAEDGSTGVNSPDIIAAKTPPMTQTRTLSLSETRHARCTWLLALEAGFTGLSSLLCGSRL